MLMHPLHPRKKSHHMHTHIYAECILLIFHGSLSIKSHCSDLAAPPLIGLILDRPGPKSSTGLVMPGDLPPLPKVGDAWWDWESRPCAQGPFSPRSRKIDPERRISEVPADQRGKELHYLIVTGMKLLHGCSDGSSRSLPIPSLALALAQQFYFLLLLLLRLRSTRVPLSATPSGGWKAPRLRSSFGCCPAHFQIYLFAILRQRP